MRQHLRLWCLLVSLLSNTVVVMAGTSSSAESDAVRISEIKAAFVLNIARFVTWPTGKDIPEDSLLLCFYKSDPIAKAGQSILKNTVAGRTIETKVIKTLRKAEQCNIVLIPGEHLAGYTQAVKKQAVYGVLTIADLTTMGRAGEAYPGVQVGLVRKDTSIGLEINIGEINRAGLRVSSKLLNLAKIVGNDE